MRKLQYTKQRRYFITYHDCLESNLFDNHYQIVVYIALEKFSDSNNQCFPSHKTLAKITLISVSKIKITLAELEEKGLINKQNRRKDDGGKTSNLYTINDYRLLLGKASQTVEEVSQTTEKTSQTVEEVSQTTEKTSQTVEEVSQTTEKTSQTVKEVSQTTEKTSQTVKEVSQTAEKTSQTVEEVSQTAEEAKKQEAIQEAIELLESMGYIAIKKMTIPVEPKKESTEPQDKSALKSVVEPKKESTEPQDKSALKSVVEPKKESTEPQDKSALKSVVGKVENKKEMLVPNIDKIHGTSNSDSNTTNEYNNTQKTKSQVSETYSLEWLKEYLCYNTIIDKLIDKYPDAQEKIDIVFNILYTNVNATNKRTRIHGDEKPPMVIKSQFLKLNSEDIIYAIEKFLQQTIKIKNPVGYLTTLLFNAHQQRCLELENLKQHEKAKKNGKSTEPQPYQKKWQPKPNQFHQFMQREVTKEELDKLERALLGNLRFNDDDNIITEETTQTKTETEMELGELERALLGNLHFKDDDNISAEEKKKKETDELERALLRKSMS